MKAIPVTGKLMILADIDVKTPVIKALKNNQAKALDAAVEAQMDACKIRYVASTASTGNFTTDGTATLTASYTMNAYHLKTIVDYLMGTMLAPPADGEFYFGIMTVAAARGLYDSLEAIWQYTQYPVNGEMGKQYLPIENFSNSVNPTAIAMGIPNQAGFGWMLN